MSLQSSTPLRSLLLLLVLLLVVLLLPQETAARSWGSDKRGGKPPPGVRKTHAARAADAPAAANRQIEQITPPTAGKAGGPPAAFVLAARGRGPQTVAKIKALVRRGKDDIDAVYLGNRALNIAIVQGNLDVVKALLAGGANPNYIGKSGGSPLHDALQKGSVSGCARIAHA